MVLSRRERCIAIVAAIVLAILLIDRLALTPLFERKAALESEKQAALEELARAGILFERRRALSERWEHMREAGLKLNRAEAESRVLHAVRDWSQAAGLSMSSVRPERVATREKLDEIMFQAAATGSLKAVSGFLYRVEESPHPIRLTEFQLGARKEGTDDLSIQFRLSALCQPAPEEEEEPSVASTSSLREETDD